MIRTSLLMALIFNLLHLSSCTSAHKNSSSQQEDLATTHRFLSYTANGETHKGFLVQPKGPGPFPGILMVHEWWGQTEDIRHKARQLAQEGYMVLAVDMFGGGYTADHPDDAKKFAQRTLNNLDDAENSIQQALKLLNSQPQIDSNKIAAVGYSFGGTLLLEMLQRGMNFKMVTTYHSRLTPLLDGMFPKTSTRLLIFNGGADETHSKSELQEIKNNLKDLGIRYKFISYKGAKHGFSIPSSNRQAKQFEIDFAYHKQADQNAWIETLKALKIVFR